MKQTKRVLSVVLALAMVFAMSIMVSAATPEAKLTIVNNGDGTVTATVLGTGENLAKFDYGIAYDSEKLEVVPFNDEGDLLPVQWGDRMLKISMKDANDQGSYIVIGGTHSADTFTVAADVVIATITFKTKDGSDAAGAKIGLVADSAAIIDAGNTVDVNNADIKTQEVPAATPATETPGTETPGTETPGTETPNQPTQPADNNQPTTPANNNQTPGGQTPGGQTPGTTKTQAPTGTTAPTKGTTPKTADTANVVLPVVAIVAAAAAVVVVSKKRVEE